VVLDGPERVLKAVPLGRFGALLTVDLQEIESLRSIRSPGQSASASDPERFPRSGRTKHCDRQRALGMGLSHVLEPKEFNLSQLESADELLSALHQVRDIGLGGKIPWFSGTSLTAITKALMAGCVTFSRPCRTASSSRGISHIPSARRSSCSRAERLRRWTTLAKT